MKLVKWFLVGLGVIYLVSKAHLISYLLMQAQGQLKVLWNAVPIDELLIAESTDKELKEKIRLVIEIKRFTNEVLGLDSEGLYVSVYDQKGGDILWNLTACKPYQLTSKEWSFPLLGQVSYKGYFDLEKAKYEEELLKKEGWDTRIRTVNAWSTLGWFPDPILSKNLQRNEGDLVELFIHEITHANIFLKDSITFNENLASFIGEQGAMLFLEQKYGRYSTQVKQYKQSNQDAQLFINQCLKGVSELGDIFESFSEQMTEEEKEKQKYEYISQWVEEVDSLQFFDKKSYHRRFSDRLPNNAFFMAFDRYDSKKESFSKELQHRFQDDLIAFIKAYKELN